MKEYDFMYAEISNQGGRFMDNAGLSKPLVTVIIPAYNHESYIEDCLKSVVCQTYQHLQIIVLNDGSQDNTGGVIEKFIGLQNRQIEYITKNNEGLCKTLNMGIERAKGKYIAFIASDDMWLPNRIEEQVIFLEQNSSIGLVFADAYFMRYYEPTTLKYSDYKTRINQHFLNSIQNTNIYEALLVENIILALTVLIRKECFEKVGLFDVSLKYEDYDMWLRVSRHYPIAYIDKPLAYYRTHDSNISNNMKIMLTGALQAIFKQYKQLPLKRQPIKAFILFVQFMFTTLKNRIIKYINV
jgi:alpha-1,3-rhamnosyltransferase